MPAFGVGCGKDKDPNCKGPEERKWAIVSLVFCIIFFIGYHYTIFSFLFYYILPSRYLVYNVKFSSEEERDDKVNQVRQEAIETRIILSS